MVYTALLRGINVGVKNRVEMTKLKKTFQELDFQNVKTYINIGNVIFESKLENENEIAQPLEKSIEIDFKLEIKVLVINKIELGEICHKIDSSWVNDKEMKTDIFFLWDEIDSPDILDLLPKNSEIDNILYLPKGIIWNVSRENQKVSKTDKLVGTKIYKKITVRNINTVRKLLSIIDKY